MASMAAYEGNLASVQDWVHGGMDPFVKDADGRTLLHWVWLPGLAVQR